MKDFPYRLGVHLSIAGGIDLAAERARDLGCSAVQIFSRNPRGWDASPLNPERARLFREKARRGGIDPVVVHTPYLLNLASAEPELRRKSVGMLSQDLERAELLGARFVVTHLGSAGDGGPSSGRKRVARGLRRVLETNCPVTLLLENSAGGGRTVGAFFEEIAAIIADAGSSPRLGFCFDSCHAYAAGYDFRSPEQGRALVEELDKIIGLQRLKVIHLNDCAGPLGSRRDRHQHIGKGEIGLGGFRSLLRQESLRKIPLILETPKERPGDDRDNLSRVRGLFPPP